MTILSNASIIPGIVSHKMSQGKLQYEQAWRFALAGTSCMTAAAVTNPIDVIKTRMQIDGELSNKGGKGVAVFSDRYYKGILRGSFKIIQDEGVRGLYKGLVPSLMREGIYSTIRLGAYEPIKRLFGGTDPHNTPLWIKICAGAVSGSIGSAIATPTDLVKVRQQGQARGQTARYSGTFVAFRMIYRAEGLRGLWVGVIPTVQRATILTATQIPAYDHTKHTILNHGWMAEGVRLHIVASMIAGLATALTTSPVDVIKTRVMNQKGQDKYKGTWDCFIKTLRSEGPLAFYKGVIPQWMRIGPHTIVTFFIFEQLRRAVGMAPV